MSQLLRDLAYDPAITDDASREKLLAYVLLIMAGQKTPSPVDRKASRHANGKPYSTATLVYITVSIPCVFLISIGCVSF